jgi:hypothetical protein
MAQHGQVLRLKARRGDGKLLWAYGGRPVVVPAKSDTSPGSVGQGFRPATTCAAADVIADVSAHTPLTAFAHTGHA